MQQLLAEAEVTKPVTQEAALSLVKRYFTLIFLCIFCFNEWEVFTPPVRQLESDNSADITIRTIKLVRATMIIETTNFDTSAYNKVSGASGILQIKKICMAEANRIVKKDSFHTTTLMESLKIWHTIQNRYNPNFDYSVGASLWISGKRKSSSKYAIWYIKKVNEIIKNQFNDTRVYKKRL